MKCLLSIFYLFVLFFIIEIPPITFKFSIARKTLYMVNKRFCHCVIQRDHRRLYGASYSINRLAFAGLSKLRCDILRNMPNLIIRLGAINTRVVRQSKVRVNNIRYIRLTFP